MPVDYLTKESSEVREAFAQLEQIERTLKETEKHYVPSIGQERYLSGPEICRYLHLSCRTLQTLRDTRQITYTTVSKRLFLYPEKEITEILERNLKTAE